MNTVLHKLLNPIKRFSNYFPFTLYFILFGCGIIISYFFLENKLVAPESSFTAVLKLIISIIVFTTLVYLSIGFILVFIAWLFLLIAKKRHLLQIHIDTSNITNNISQSQTLQIKITPILKPFLGFIKIKFRYDGDEFSEKLSIASLGTKTLFSKNCEGIIHWQLPQIKEYSLQSAIIYFEDYFQFFSLPIYHNIQINFIANPQVVKINSINTQPRKTEETKIRIADLRKVEGEYLNYKNFENNDDVRRIVWKIYAKNKELVIRTPEVLDPFASHVYLYASFYSSFQFNGNNIIEIPFLNYYKTLIWSAYQQLCKQNYEVKLVADQKANATSILSDANIIKNHLSICEWQQNKNLKEYCKISEASILIISSLNNALEVQQIIEQSSNSITIILIKLSDSLKNNKIIDWIEWIFIQKEKNEMEKYKANWNFNSLRNKILSNEKQLEAMIQNQMSAIKLETVTL